MSAPQIYARVDVFVDGTLLMEEATVELTRKTGSQPISSVQKDYAGESPGAKTLEIRVTSGVPAAGFELSPGKYQKDLTFCVLTLVSGSLQLTSQGQIFEDTLSHGVNQETKSMISFRGAWSDWS